MFIENKVLLTTIKETTVGEDGENKAPTCRCFIKLTFPVSLIYIFSSLQTRRG